ncbi:hypothetical protein N8630_02995 [Synechococcus sp. AH-601-C19]|nr:hypothetical protein [Synechococcus sp. AH-601-C19]
MSTLHVENLKGLSSGGNANKIIVPSGQTLDASAGVLTPSAGQIVQQVEYFDDATFSTQSTSFVTTLCTLNITPKFSNSKINIFITGGGYASSHQTFKGQLQKNGSNFANYASEDLALYSTVAQHMGQTIGINYTDQNVGTTSSVTYAYYVKSTGGQLIYFYRNYGIILQEIKV